MPSTPANRSNRSGSKTMVIVLKLSPKLLSQFAGKEKANSNSPKGKEGKERKDASPTSSVSDPLPRPSSADNASDAASTPAPAPANGADRRKSGQAPKTGTKRTFNQASEASKSRGRPGSRKKPKVEDGAEPNKPAATGHRLGPKANTGAINAQLRALDRSGAPCRKWERKPLHLKSFTGIQWHLASWRAPKDQKVETNGENVAAKDGALDVGDSDSKANHSASAVPSEKSNSGADGEFTPVGQRVVESPTPAIAMTA